MRSQEYADLPEGYHLGAMLESEPSFKTLGFLVADKFSNVTLGTDGVLALSCPLCNRQAHLMLTATETGDAVWCDGVCEDSAVERAVRYLVKRLPDRCREHERFRNSTCSRCLAYSSVAQRTYAQMSRELSAPELESEVQPILSSLADAEPVPDASILLLPDGSYLLRPGWVHLFHGKPFCGKTPLAYLAVVEVVQAGGCVLLVDHEMGRSGAKALLMELGLSEAQIRAQVLYAYNPRQWTQVQRDRLASEVEARDPALVVIDSLSRSMSTAGLDQNDATETDAWFHSFAIWAADTFGSAVLIIDHTNRVDGPHPSGSIQKTAAPQLHVWVQNVKPFSRDHEDGCSLLMVQKDRSGQRSLGRPVAELRTVLWGSFTLRAVDQKMASAVAGDTVEISLPAWADEEQKHLDALAQAGSQPLTRGQLVGEGGAANKPRREALDRLVAKGLVIEWPQPGTARGKWYWLAENFPGAPGD
jgi:hypothetical protein